MNTKHYFLLTFSAIILSVGTSTAQKFPMLEKYTSTYYELEFDDNGNEVINTKCNEPTVYLKFICSEELQNCHFTYEETIFQITSMSKGNSDEEYLIKYKNDFGEEAAAIFYYDRVVHQLLLTFDGMNLAFVAKEDLDKFTVKDQCN